ncbi:hypothetical protein TCDM_03132 [Trypanosoma cruzi Dm28c]|uniref:MIF4G domain-containing protein n=1 Tax=Trypanosoma cruzi Dm28c TaxID=1416333 RepID=V5DL88_TRYCR|nr:hypothetical protein TCDM_03132 [Trypanosoma cruzi Dm28c]PBJ80049.1 Eukaryotic translation initiation factor 4 gamma [Trypanosoma cruzi cruzi]
MEPLRAASVEKPRRTSSVPGSLTRASHRRSIPQSLVDALCAARESFERYGVISLLETAVRAPVDGAREAALMVLKDDRDENPQQQQQQQQQMELSTSLPGVSPAPPTTVPSGETKMEACAASTERAIGETVEGEMPTTTAVTNKPTSIVPDPPKEKLTASFTCLSYDATVTREAMKRLKHVVEYCPGRTAAFLEQLREVVATTVHEIPAAPPIAVSRLKSNSSAYHTARQLEALSELWGNRRDAPVSVSSTLGRKRGLFGEVERKELHHLVISILNRVSNDTEKYREVKNELLRLPIPEANDAMLAKIVDVFFLKAVREQHFSNLYADLVSALCKVPGGQRIVGDKQQSLEYRMRQQLLHRCQMEFRQLEEQSIERAERGGEDRASQGAEESFKERRDRVCGIVRFVGELFLRHIVTEKVIGNILVTACTGLYGREGLCVPPPYTPTESQMDETITLLGIVDAAFFRTPLGSSMLVECTQFLQHWSLRHPVSRIRFLLMSAVERLQKLVEERNAAIAASQEQLQLQQQQQQTTQTADDPQQVQQSVQDGKRLTNGSVILPQPLSPRNEESYFNSTGSRSTSAMTNDMSVKSKHLVFVGGKPIPAPRSAASRQCSVMSITSSNYLTNFSVQLTKQLATSENVAQHMQNVTLATRSLDEVVEEIMKSFADYIAVVGVWTERCLTVVKAVKDRSLYGAFLSSLNRYHKGTSKQELRKVAMSTFANAVCQRLHEDLGIFKYWAAMILSDTMREVLDEDLLNEALHYLLVNDPAAVKVYLRDVAKHMQAASSSPRTPSDETTNFTRYRPLQVVHRHNTHRKREYELNVVNFPDVRLASMEIHVFCALITGTPSKEALFNAVRSSSYLRCPLMAPEIFSAILHAELCSNTTAYLEDNLDLLSLVVDGQDREIRELLLVAELYVVLKEGSNESLRPLSAGAHVMAKLGDSIISDETRLRAQKYFESRDDCAHHYIGAQSAQLQARHVPSSGSSSVVNNSSSTNSNNNNMNTNSVVRRPAIQRR